MIDLWLPCSVFACRGWIFVICGFVGKRYALGVSGWWFAVLLCFVLIVAIDCGIAVFFPRSWLFGNWL